MIRKFNKNLMLLLSGQGISQLGDKFYMLALSLWVLDVTKSPAMMGIVLFCSQLPSTVLGFVSGVFIDKYNRKILLIGADIIRGLVVVLVACFYLSGILNIPLVICAQILLSICAAFFDPAIPSIIPQIVDKDKLVKANSLSQFVRGFVSIAGPVLGGLAVAFTGYFTVFIFNAVSYFASACCEVFLKLPKMEKSMNTLSSLKNNLVEGYKYIFANTNLIIILIIICLVHFFVGAFMVWMPLTAVGIAGTKAANLGYIETAFGAGALVMPFILTIINIKKKEVPLLFAAIFFFGVFFIIGGIFKFLDFTSVIPYIFLFFAFSMLIMLAGTCFYVILQRDVDNAMSGRVFSVSMSLGNLSLPFSSLVYGILFEKGSHTAILVLTGVVLILINIILNRGYKRKGSSEPKSV